MKTRLVSRRTYLVFRRTFLVSRRTYLVSRRTFLVSPRTYLVSRWTFFVSRKTLIFLREELLHSSKDLYDTIPSPLAFTDLELKRTAVSHERCSPGPMAAQWWLSSKHLDFTIVFPIKIFGKPLKILHDSSRTTFWHIRWKLCLVILEKNIENIVYSPRYPVGEQRAM